MPRMKTPNGYYTMSEATRVLNLSSAMVRRYVEKDQIRYLLPPGRGHGFYLKEDVDKLANMLNAFINIEDGNDKIVFRRANKDDLKEIVRIANSLFSSQNTTEIIVPQWRHDILEKNPETLHVLTRNEDVIGFVEALPFRTNTHKIDILLGSNRVADAKITTDDIDDFIKGKRINIYIAGIGVDPKIEKKKRKEYGARLIGETASFIVCLGKRGVIIENISAQGFSHMGIRILQSFGLHEIPQKSPGKRAFTMNIQESGAPVSQQYKQALAESGVLSTKEYTTSIN